MTIAAVQSEVAKARETATATQAEATKANEELDSVKDKPADATSGAAFIGNASKQEFVGQSNASTLKLSKIKVSEKKKINLRLQQLNQVQYFLKQDFLMILH